MHRAELSSIRSIQISDGVALLNVTTCGKDVA